MNVILALALVLAVPPRDGVRLDVATTEFSNERLEPNVGPALAARLRHGPGPYDFLVEGLTSTEVRLLGATVRAEVGSIISARGDLRAIRELAKKARIDAPKALRPTLDKSRTVIGADQADFAEGFASPHRGAGVLVGMYDSGLDLRHPDFATLEGASRIFGIKDESSGVTCDSSKVTAGTCAVAEDTLGHGTLTMSVALGNGPRYRGIAPEAEALMVRSDSFEDLVGALAWLDQQATAAKKPLVINVSLGGHSGPHDGTSLESKALSEVKRLVVMSAGNDGSSPIHFRTELGAPKRIVVDFRPGSTRGSVAIWGAPEGSISPEVSIVDADGQTVAETGTVAPGAGRTFDLRVNGARAVGVDVDVQERDPANGRPNARLGFEVDFDALGPNKIVIGLSGSGQAHGWTDAPADIPQVPVFSTQSFLGPDQVLGDSESTVSDPATAPGVISVSSFQSRSEPPSELVGPDGVLGPISDFSSRGPTLHATAKKPDLAAPGEIIVGARSKEGPSVGSIGDLYRAASGTSMAAPHVAGAAALLYEANEAATPDAIRELILSNAAPEDQDERFGRGRLDVAAALHEATGESSCGCRTTGTDAGWIPFALSILFLQRTRRRRSPRA